MNVPEPDQELEQACGVFTERWMQAYAQSWNAEQVMVQELMRLRFSAVIGYGFLDATTPRGMLVVIRGHAAHAGDYDGRDLDLLAGAGLQCSGSVDGSCCRPFATARRRLPAHPAQAAPDQRPAAGVYAHDGSICCRTLMGFPSR